MSENQKDATELGPQSTFRVLDFESLPERLSTDEKFRAEVEKLCEGEDLNLTFPRVLNYQYASGYGQDYFKRLTAFPDKLLDSDTYTGDLELRGPMEEIILVTNSQRGKYGFPLLEPKGDGWSDFFKARLETIKNDFPTQPTKIKDSDRQRKRRVARYNDRGANSLDNMSTLPHGKINYRRNNLGESVIKGRVLPHKPSD